MSTGTLWLSCSSSALSLSSLLKPKPPPPPPSNHPHCTQKTGRPDPVRAFLHVRFAINPHRHFERSGPTFSSAFAPANASACVERNLSSPFLTPLRASTPSRIIASLSSSRSEERRVGNECRSRW